MTRRLLRAALVLAVVAVSLVLLARGLASSSVAVPATAEMTERAPQPYQHPCTLDANWCRTLHPSYPLSTPAPSR